MLQPTDLCTNTGERVTEVLCTKNLDERPLTASILDRYTDLPPEIVPMDITDDTVTEVDGKLSGWARPGGDGLSETPALDPAFWSGKRGDTSDCCRLCGVVRQRAAPMGRLLSYDERPADHTGKEDRIQASCGWENLAAADG